ncbi:MAG: SRPBCC family protein [Prolixibacteraceae bacterium]|nr:SRPBCC family protein [Prolixibacteraceae bacterium]MBN2772926.1 SRPBCC family protein [Prolixibacteraceae bacterium]
MIHKIEQKQILPIKIEKAWAFFSSPQNLNNITPDDLHFEITSNLPEKIYEGLIITYKITPFPLIKFECITEISTVINLEYFIDTQIKGPYRIWHHQHHFKKVTEGTEMTDIVYYALPFGLLGEIVHSIKIKKQLLQIFAYRKSKLEELFGIFNPQNQG